jgi:hypothetical protein
VHIHLSSAGEAQVQDPVSVIKSTPDEAMHTVVVEGHRPGSIGIWLDGVRLYGIDNL